VAPKIYVLPGGTARRHSGEAAGLVLAYCTIIRKARSVGENLILDDYINLYLGESISKNKEYWVRDRSQGSVTVVQRNITLSPHLNKREKFYYNGLCVGTRPFIVKDGVLIQPSISTNFKTSLLSLPVPLRLLSITAPPVLLSISAPPVLLSISAPPVRLALPALPSVTPPDLRRTP
jgi:hypothetical protein